MTRAWGPARPARGGRRASRRNSPSTRPSRCRRRPAAGTAHRPRLGGPDAPGPWLRGPRVRDERHRTTAALRSASRRSPRASS